MFYMFFVNVDQRETPLSSLYSRASPPTSEADGGGVFPPQPRGVAGLQARLHGSPAQNRDGGARCRAAERGYG